MWGMGRSLRENKRGVGFLGHPVVLGLIFAVIALLVLALFVPLVIVASVGAVLVLIGAFGLGVAGRMSNWWGVLVSVILLVIGIAMIYAGYAVAFS